MSKGIRLRRAGTQLLLAAGALFGLLQCYAFPSRWNRGPESRWWEKVRRLVSRHAGRLDRQAGPRGIAPGEFAGSLSRPPAATERLLYDRGFIRNPSARLKLREGAPEYGSWVYRDSPLAPRQLHLMLFEGDDGGTDVYAHEELSSVNPLCGASHFSGDGQSVQAGVRRAREWLPLDTSSATVEPPVGSWNSAETKLSERN